ncbi:hypothetical protein GCM10027277_17170 [Pseudoduganella ginsengisoli]|uniref:Uncharacterized protein n=1 Tax=Pseudoduganella ginsengisoli TaxID=1462440 RepID=A0A6L6PUW3_9BURK|nr:hypothetical protein [Pseudoduganella ginsengisoli]MTW01021.1 hypothetical protein [Pseudoduganella ginsengisoli]
MSLTERLTAALRALLPPVTRRSLRIYLAPQHVVIAAADGGRVTGAVTLPVANPGGHWEAPLATLRGLMEHPGEILSGSEERAAQIILAALTAQAPLSISLSGRWCQSVMAPWSDALLAEPAATRFLQMQLSAVYGDAARGWNIASDDAPYGQPRAACGIDADLLQALRTDLGKRCGAIEPIIGTASRMQTGFAAFAIVEPGKLTMATMAHGRLAAICSQPCGPAWHVELGQAWQRWALRLPELESITTVAVIDLTCQPPARHALAPLFQLVESPFGPASALVSAKAQEALCA